MVNYRRVVCEVALFAALTTLAAAAPVPDVHYDQRQNGTENVRVNIDGLVIAIAPAESLIAAASDIDLGDLIDLDYFTDIQKPSSKPPQESVLKPKPEEEPKPEEQKPNPEEKPSLQEDKPKPQEEKPEEPAKPEAAAGNLKSYHHAKGQKKDASTRKQS